VTSLILINGTYMVTIQLCQLVYSALMSNRYEEKMFKNLSNTYFDTTIK